MVLVEDAAGRVGPMRVRAWDRVRARLRAARLDAALAAGASPDASVELSLRARALTSTASRQAFARALLTLITRAIEPPAVVPLRVPARRARVLDASWQLERLEQSLLGRGPVSVRGVALTKVLLSQGDGPLYGRRGGDDVSRLVARIARALSIEPI
jgi:hypothetical protein